MLLTRSRPFGPNGQLVDLAFRVLDSLVARVAQANGRNGDWRSIGIGAGQRVERLSDRREDTGGVDISLRQ